MVPHSMLEAARRGDPEAVRIHLDAGVSVDLQEEFSRCTALMLTGSREVAALLLDRGAAVDLQDRRGRTALMQTDDREMAALLLDRGAKDTVPHVRCVYPVYTRCGCVHPHARLLAPVPTVGVCVGYLSHVSAGRHPPSRRDAAAPAMHTHMHMHMHMVCTCTCTGLPGVEARRPRCGAAASQTGGGCKVFWPPGALWRFGLGFAKR